MAYKLTTRKTAIEIATGIEFPLGADGNSDYERFKSWQEAGNAPIPAETHDEARNRLWETIKAMRDALIQVGGYPLNGFWFHSDAYSLSQQQGLILAAMQVQASGGDMDAPLMATPWQAMGGVPVVMTASLALRLLPAGMAKQVAIFEAAKAHKAALDSCVDPANYDFSGGWPQVFGE